MIVFILGCLLLLGGAACAIFGKYQSVDRNTYRWPFVAAGAVIALLGLFLFQAPLHYTVNPSDTAITTAFGKTQGPDQGPGVHLKAPWMKVTIWDNSVLSETFDGKDCLVLRIMNQQTACAPVTVFWKDDPANADKQFRQFRTFARVRHFYMSRIVVGKYFNNVFETFDPVSEARSGAKIGSKDNPTVSQLAATVEKQMQAAYAGQITVKSITVGQPDYDPQVQAALNKVTTAQAATNVALQAEKTAEAIHSANLKIASGLTPLVVQQNCITITQVLAQEGNPPAQGWNCFGGSPLALSSGK